LLPDLLVRRRLSLQETRVNGIGRTVPDPLPEVEAAALPLSEIASAHPTNKVVSLDAVIDAHLHRGRTNDRLALRMCDGSRHKLLWLKADPAYEVLAQALGQSLGSHLVMD